MTSLPLWFKGLTPELSKKAEEELGETISAKKEALDELRRLIKEQQDLHSRLDDSFLLRFLRGKKFDAKKSFSTLRNYYNFKNKQAGVFTCFKPSDLKHVMDMNILNYAPFRCPDGSHVTMVRIGAFNPKLAKPEDLVATVLICAELIFECEATQICGGNIIIDFKGMTLQHYTMFLTVSFIKFVVNTLQDCWPERIKGVHFVRQPSAFSAVYQIVRPFMKKKLIDRFHFHGNTVKGLHAYVSRDMLPEELGGTLGPFNNKEYASYFYSQEEFIEKSNMYGKVK